MNFAAVVGVSLWSELIAGETLSRRLTDQFPVPLDQVVLGINARATYAVPAIITVAGEKGRPAVSGILPGQHPRQTRIFRLRKRQGRTRKAEPHTGSA